MNISTVSTPLNYSSNTIPILSNAIPSLSTHEHLLQEIADTARNRYERHTASNSSTLLLFLNRVTTHRQSTGQAQGPKKQARMERQKNVQSQTTKQGLPLSKTLDFGFNDLQQCLKASDISLSLNQHRMLQALTDKDMTAQDSIIMMAKHHTARFLRDVFTSMPILEKLAAAHETDPRDAVKTTSGNSETPSTTTETPATKKPH